MPTRSLQSLARFAAGLTATGLLLKLLQYTMPQTVTSPVAAKVALPMGAQVADALLGTVSLAGYSLLLALGPALLVGIPAGLRPGTRLDRLLRAPAAALAGVPSIAAVLVFVGLLSMRTRWLDLDSAIYISLAVGVWPWLTLAIRDGLAGAIPDGGSLSWPRAVAGVAGRLLGQTGNIAVATLLPGLFLTPPTGALTLLEAASRTGDLLLIYMVLAVGLPPVLLAHLAGDLLAGEGRAAPPRSSVRLSRVWLAAGLVLAALLVATTVLPPAGAAVDAARLQAPGAAHWLGMDPSGRDLLKQVGAATRVTGTLALVAAAVALAGGAGLGIVARFTGDVGATVLASGTDGFALLPAFVAGLAVPVIWGRSVWLVGVAIGVVSVGMMIAPLRRLFSTAPGEARGRAALGAAGALLLVVIQAILTEVALGTLGSALPVGTPSLGALARDGLRVGRAAHLVLPALLTAAGLAGLSLLAHALLEAAAPVPDALEEPPSDHTANPSEATIA
jgi:peptide/nickel transport system permease protein